MVKNYFQKCFQKTQKEWLTLRKATQEDFEKSPETGVKQAVVDKIGNALTTIPENFKPYNT